MGDTTVLDRSDCVSVEPFVITDKMRAIALKELKYQRESYELPQNKTWKDVRKQVQTTGCGPFDTYDDWEKAMEVRTGIPIRLLLELEL